MFFLKPFKITQVNKKQKIIIPEITLEWSNWFNWNEFKKDARSDKSAVRVPPTKGVYEVKSIKNNQILTIGKGSNLRMRIKQGLVKGKTPHSSGKKIKKYENVKNLQIHWAETSRPSAVEEDLHIKFYEKHNKFPEYTKHT